MAILSISIDMNGPFSSQETSFIVGEREREHLPILDPGPHSPGGRRQKKPGQMIDFKKKKQREKIVKKYINKN